MNDLEKQALEYAGTYGEGQLGFIAGAKWAEKNSDITQKVLKLEEGGVYITFNATDFEAVRELKSLLKSGERASKLDEIYNKCRSLLKHSEFKTLEEAHDFVEQIKQEAADFDE